MGADPVEVVTEGIEAGLLFGRIGGGWFGGFLLEGKMEAFMGAVLLGLSCGDALQGDAGPEPAKRQAAQAPGPGTAKGGPLSERIVLGRPWRWKTASNAAPTGPCSGATIRHNRT